MLKTSYVQKHRELPSSEGLHASCEKHDLQHRSENGFLRLLEAHVRRPKKIQVLYFSVW